MNIQNIIKTCFVVCPIGGENTNERKRADWLFTRIQRSIKDSNFDIMIDRSDKVFMPGTINGQIIESIINSDIVIADLSNLNPNVFYEIGLRHMIRKPIIHVAIENTILPFDVSGYRTIFYDIHKPEELEKGIASSIDAIQKSGFKPVIDSESISIKANVQETKNAISKSADIYKGKTKGHDLVILNGEHIYRNDGRYIGELSPKEPHPYDIVEIISKT